MAMTMASFPLHPGEVVKTDTMPNPCSPLLVNVEVLSQLLGVSVRSVWRMHSGHRIPKPVRLAGSVRWRLGEIQAWVDAGCPPLKN